MLGDRVTCFWQQFRRDGLSTAASYLRNCKPAASAASAAGVALTWLFRRPLCSSLPSCSFITALLHYRIIAFVGSPQKVWIASLRFLCDSALSELVTGFVGALHLRVLSAFDLRLTSNTKTSHPTLSLQPRQLGPLAASREL